MKYKYTLPYDYYYQSDRLIGIEFCNEWIKIRSDGCIIISKVYSWNGCTLAPDFKETYSASLIHDALYQFKPCKRKVADLIFNDILTVKRFKYKKLYFKAVRFFGWFFYIW